MKLTMYNRNFTSTYITCNFVAARLEEFDEMTKYAHCSTPTDYLSSTKFQDMRHGFRSFYL
jgi:hypothetical protein